MLNQSTGFQNQEGKFNKLPAPPHWIWSTEILFQNFQIFHDILLNLANFRGGALSKSMQIPKKRIKTVGNHVQTVGTCKNDF